MPHTRSELAYGYLDTPIGRLTIAGDGKCVHEIRFPTDDGKGPQGGWRRDDALFAGVFEQLTAYFAGGLTQFDLQLYMGGTEFQKTVWTALIDIPFGETTSYGALARRIGRPKASRAVGAANGANPLPIVVPCHRVIGSDRSLTGFGGGLPVKRFLLEHERRIQPGRGTQACLPI